MSPFPSSTPPLQPIRTPLLYRTATSWNATPDRSIYGDGAPQMAITGANAGGAGYLASGISGIRLIPNAGGDQANRLNGSNGSQRFAGTLVPLLQGGPNPIPGTRWEMHYRMGVGCTITPDTTGEDTQCMFGISSVGGFASSRPNGPGVWLAALGDGGPNWRVWALDDGLGTGGTVTVNVDTGVAFTAAPQLLEWVWGNDGVNNFVRAEIDGAVVWNPALPVAAGYPTTEGAIDVQLQVLRGGNAADVIVVDVADDIGPTLFVDVYP